jgi:hypothetical protein
MEPSAPFGHYVRKGVIPLNKACRPSLISIHAGDRPGGNDRRGERYRSAEGIRFSIDSTAGRSAGPAPT